VVFANSTTHAYEYLVVDEKVTNSRILLYSDDILGIILAGNRKFKRLNRIFVL